MKEKWGGNRKKMFDSEIWGKHCLKEACESPVGLSMCDNPMETVFIKRWVHLERRGYLR